MIVEASGGYAFRCDACGAFLELSRREVEEPDARLQRKDAMRELHSECATYPNREAAAAALKVKRKQAVQAVRGTCTGPLHAGY